MPEVAQVNTAGKNRIAFKKDYEAMAESTMNMIRQAKKNKWGKEDIVSLYGIFYSSVAGLIRSGALVSRRTGIDGLPELHVSAGDKEYRARESAVYGILGEELSDILHPYEDTFESYAGNGMPRQKQAAEGDVPETSAEPQKATEPKTSSKRKNRTGVTTDELVRAKSDYEEKLKKLETKYQKELNQLKNELKAAKLKSDSLSTKPEADPDLLQKLDQANETIRDLKSSLSTAEENRQKNEGSVQTVTGQLEEERKKWEQERAALKEEADRWKSECEAANEILPELIKQTDTSKMDMAVKAALMFAAVAGIVLSFLFLV